jgi:hypothetical protein
MTPRILSAKPLPEYWIEVEYEGDGVKFFDMKPYLDLGIFRALKDERLFCTVRVAFDTVEWSNGVDIDPDELYANSTSRRMALDRVIV